MSNDGRKSSSKDETAVYSALTLILLIFLIQAGFGMFVSITKNINIRAKIQKVKQLHKKAQTKNDKLKYELKSFNSAKSLEAIARNNLKMAGENEVLVIINTDNLKPKELKKLKEEKEKGIIRKNKLEF